MSAKEEVIVLCAHLAEQLMSRDERDEEVLATADKLLRRVLHDTHRLWPRWAHYIEITILNVDRRRYNEWAKKNAEKLDGRNPFPARKDTK